MIETYNHNFFFWTVRKRSTVEVQSSKTVIPNSIKKIRELIIMFKSKQNKKIVVSSFLLSNMSH